MIAGTDQLIRILEVARRLLVFTGAGISTPSGIADFRGPQGVWTRRSPVYYQDFLASEEARIEYWDGKLEAWESFRDAKPNPAHEAIVRLERAGKVEAVVTQNIDGLHQAAGTSPERLVELHGTNARVECLGCGRRTRPDPHCERFARERRCPRCEECGGLLKFATISFGQSLRAGDLERAFRAAAAADAVLALGSTLSVHPANGIPLAAASRGIPYAIVNRGETDHDGRPEVSVRIEGDVAVLLPPAVDAALREAAGPGPPRPS